jgi:hypothetical protein
MWEAVGWVSGIFSLLAFVAAVVGTIWRRKLDTDVETIRQAPESERARIIMASRGVLFDVETDNLTKQQRFDLAAKQIETAVTRYLISVRLIAALAAFATIVTVIALVMSTIHEKGKAVLEERNKNLTASIREITEAKNKLEEKLREADANAAKVAGRIETLIELAEADSALVISVKNLKTLLRKFDATYAGMPLPKEEASKIAAATETYNRARVRLFGPSLPACIANHYLSSSARAAISELLKSHPHYQEAFIDKMPAEVASGPESDKEAWLFVQAGRWPDIVRGKPEWRNTYHHAAWHYMEHPIVIDEAVGPPSPIGENVVTAMNLAYQQLIDPANSDQGRAIYLCWLINLTVEIHKPTHVVSCYSKTFPNGDRGGNMIRLANGQSLHSVWCGEEGQLQRFDALKARAELLLLENEGIAAGKRAAPGDWENWQQESYAIANQYVYDANVRAIIRSQKLETISTTGIELPESYFATAQKLSRPRTVLCGARLASLLEHCLVARTPM